MYPPKTCTFSYLNGLQLCFLCISLLNSGSGNTRYKDFTKEHKGNLVEKHSSKKKYRFYVFAIRCSEPPMWNYDHLAHFCSHFVQNTNFSKSLHTDY